MKTSKGSLSFPVCYSGCREDEKETLWPETPTYCLLSSYRLSSLYNVFPRDHYCLSASSSGTWLSPSPSHSSSSLSSIKSPSLTPSPCNSHYQLLLIYLGINSNQLLQFLHAILIIFHNMELYYQFTVYHILCSPLLLTLI